MYPENGSLKYFGKYFVSERQAIVVALYIGAYKVDLIHEVGHNNMVEDVLSEREEFQAVSTIHILVANVCR